MDKYILWFISLDIRNKVMLQLIEMYNNEENIYNNINEILNKKVLSEKEEAEISEKTIASGQLLLNKLIQEGIEFVTIGDRKYPEKLRNIAQPPYVLFYKGNLECAYLELVAVIGARKNTAYGAEVTKAIVRNICDLDLGTVSGVAYGIDSIAHKATLVSKGKTVGVLGCGLDIVYPPSNKRLYEEIIKEGLLVSEFPPGEKPNRYNFPRRNRIISGLCKWLIVVEASVKSGSLITVNYALEQGKEIMAVPGPVFNYTSQGCNKLIKDGAFSFTEIEDLYRFLNKNKNNVKNIEINSKERELWQIIGCEPIHIDKIIESVNIDRIALYELLFEMQNKNKIICLPGNYYAKLS